VTERADVVLPVAPAVEKSGRYVTWEGRRRPFDLTITNPGSMSDARVLDALAEELDVALQLPTIDAVRAELVRLAGPGPRAAAPQFGAAAPAVLSAGQAVLATWPELIDEGRMQVGDEHLAGTAKPARAILSPATATGAGLADGGHVSVSTEHGTIVAPVLVDPTAADGVVWLPTNARGCAVRKTLGVTSGAVVTLTDSDAPPIVGAGGGS
jgi:NADH-quinone oxidoreductase subunit G